MTDILASMYPPGGERKDPSPTKKTPNTRIRGDYHSFADTIQWYRKDNLKTPFSVKHSF